MSKIWRRSALISLLPMLSFASAQAAEKVIYSFQGAPDAAAPFGALAVHASSIYGSSYQGGSTACGSSGCGTVYQITLPTVDGKQQVSEKVIYEFQGGADGQGPIGGVTRGDNDVLYGTTAYGGSGSGTVFALYPSKTGWTKLTLHTFSGSDGSTPNTPLLLGSDGALYGAAGGTVFRIVAPKTAKGKPQESTVYPVGGTLSGLVGDPATGLYGAILYGGTGACSQSSSAAVVASGCGEVYELTQSSGVWSFTPIYSLQGPPNDGQGANGLALGANGTLYGTAYDGGDLVGSTDAPKGGGILYSLAQTGVGGAWQEIVQYSFDNPGAGLANPARVLVTSAGKIMGATSPRDLDAKSVMFQLTPGAGGGTLSKPAEGPGSEGNSGGLALAPLYADEMVGAAAYEGSYGAVFTFRQ